MTPTRSRSSHDEYREIIGPPDPAPVAAVIRITRGDPIEAKGNATGPGDPGQDGHAQDGRDPATADGQGDGENATTGGDDGDSEGAGTTANGNSAGGEGQGTSEKEGEGQGDSAGSEGQGDGDGKGQGEDGAGAGQGGGGAGQGGGGDSDGESSSEEPADGPTLGSLADALRDAAEHAQAGQLEQFDEDVSLKDVLDHAAKLPRGESATGREGTGAPAGRMPDRGVDRPPMPDEVRAATVFAPPSNARAPRRWRGSTSGPRAGSSAPATTYGRSLNASTAVQ